ncbi:hypothetical protein [Encephalitozoon cuniculi GB-M1]|uniref:Uncharacterized protein ECU07_1090 n=1 Tax=Encephalitozoon cuniculi (strain GB-M1) TaxID=284813 RepID=Y7A9_ENCCU|nr:uncharacterized protein ECU07_1090 [Encephalitozoon cuniculi GB-M1]Q8SUY7.1 RecName: Full=Uncharacterized protein ECU07_1090; Flags: Precursor [Encephalitozoon cuniculi GB-M1]CAD25642.1 hypothetical protein [Encephalitozoon cuniculi GB-M1]
MELGLILMFASAFVSAKDRELEEFVEKDIKVFFSSYPAQVLGMEEDQGVLVSHSKYVNPSKYKFVTRARLVKSGERYVVIFGENNICKEGNSVVKCKEERPWDIDRKEFGYTISTDNKCITKGPDESIEMKPCVNTDDQIFGFKLADLGGCGSVESLLGSEKPKSTTTNVNIFQPESECLPSVMIKADGDVEKIEENDVHVLHKEGAHTHVIEEAGHPLYEESAPSKRRVVVSHRTKRSHLPGTRRTYLGHHHFPHHHLPHHYRNRTLFERKPVVF